MALEDDEPPDEGLYDYVTTRDRFGVPSNLMGTHPEDFFSILGRIVALSATLEYRVLSFYQALAGEDQHAFADLGVSRVIRGARSELPRLRDPGDRELAAAFLDEAKAITKRRNDYVHNLWPAQPGEKTFGWRLAPKPGVTEPLIVNGTMNEMQADLNRIVAFLEVSYQHRIHGLVSSGHHLSDSG